MKKIRNLLGYLEVLKDKNNILAVFIQVYLISKIFVLFLLNEKKIKNTKNNKKRISTFSLTFTVEYSTLKIAILIKILVLIYANLRVTFFLVFSKETISLLTNSNLCQKIRICLFMYVTVYVCY